MSNKLVLIPLGIFAVIFLYLSMFFVLVPSIHDSQLKQFTDPLFLIRVPEDTEVVSLKSEIGLLFANGNHCDYFAGSMVTTSLSKIDLEEYYIQEYAGDFQVEFVWLDEENEYTTDIFSSKRIYSIDDWLDELDVSLIQDDDETVGIVYIFSPHHVSSFDYRCR